MELDDTIAALEKMARQREPSRVMDAEVAALATAYSAFATQPADAHERMLEWLGARLRADATERAREATEAERAERAKKGAR